MRNEAENDMGESPEGGRRLPRRKQYGIWLRLLVKRLWRQPAYLLLLVLLPVLGCAVSVVEQGDKSGAAVAVCVADGSWAAQITDGLRAQEADSVLTYVFCGDEAETEDKVLYGEADCGFVIPEDIEERVMESDWHRCVTAYETDASSITGMAKERIAEVIFRQYSEQSYRAYLSELQPDAIAFAWDAYENHLADGSTFGFHYLYDDQYSQSEDDTDAAYDTYDTTVFPLKGVFAVVIFIGGMCGMLEYDRDLQEKRFFRLAPNVLTYIVNVWLPTVFLSAAALVCLWLTDGIRAAGGQGGLDGMLSVWSAEMWLAQIGRLVVYQGMIVGYCLVLRLFLRRRETVAAAIPLLTLGCLVCAPVFIRLAAYVPVFAVLEKFFPVTYYLRL